MVRHVKELAAMLTTKPDTTQVPPAPPGRRREPTHKLASDFHKHTMAYKHTHTQVHTCPSKINKC